MDARITYHQEDIIGSLTKESEMINQAEVAEKELDETKNGWRMRRGILRNVKRVRGGKGGARGKKEISPSKSRARRGPCPYPNGS